jgi:hypothetical protein
MSDLEARLRALEAEVARLRDQLEIYQLVTSYGPAVDAGLARRASELWTEDGTYDAQVGSWTGRSAIAGMVDGATHQGLIHSGCAHVIGMPHIRVEGDSAVVTCYARLYRHDPAADGFRVWRLTANRWELTRTSEGWRIRSRVNRQLDGSQEARDLLALGVGGPAQPDPAIPSRTTSPK